MIIDLEIEMKKACEMIEIEKKEGMWQERRRREEGEGGDDGQKRLFSTLKSRERKYDYD